MKNFITRAITGAVYAAVMIYGIYGEEFPFFIFGLAALLQFICTKELFSLSKKLFPDSHFPISHFFISVVANLLFLIFLIVGDAFGYILLFLIPVVYITSIIFSKKNIIPSVMTSVISIIYIGVPINLMVQLKEMDKIIPLAVLIMIWTNDTMAYITGSMIGKTPLSPISPKKTIEGTAGGVFFTVLFSALFGLYYTGTDIPFWIWMSIGLLVGIFGNIGDLFESFLKRKAGVKDSGRILPGHGGMLDRLDSILLAFPVVYVFIYLVNLINFQ